jgi:hypothetical protein
MEISLYCLTFQIFTGWSGVNVIKLFSLSQIVGWRSFNVGHWQYFKARIITGSKARYNTGDYLMSPGLTSKHLTSFKNLMWRNTQAYLAPPLVPKKKFYPFLPGLYWREGAQHSSDDVSACHRRSIEHSDRRSGSPHSWLLDFCLGTSALNFYERNWN